MDTNLINNIKKQNSVEVDAKKMLRRWNITRNARWSGGKVWIVARNWEKIFGSLRESCEESWNDCEEMLGENVWIVARKVEMTARKCWEITARKVGIVERKCRPDSYGLLGSKNIEEIGR